VVAVGYLSLAALVVWLGRLIAIELLGGMAPGLVLLSWPVRA
jgi:hypothetical protein